MSEKINSPGFARYDNRAEPSRLDSSASISMEFSCSSADLITSRTLANFIRFSCDVGMEKRIAAKSTSSIFDLVSSEMKRSTDRGSSLLKRSSSSAVLVIDVLTGKRLPCVSRAPRRRLRARSRRAWASAGFPNSRDAYSRDRSNKKSARVEFEILSLLDFSETGLGFFMLRQACL